MAVRGQELVVLLRREKEAKAHPQTPRGAASSILADNIWAARAKRKTVPPIFSFDFVIFLTKRPPKLFATVRRPLQTWNQTKDNCQFWINQGEIGVAHGKLPMVIGNWVFVDYSAGVHGASRTAGEDDVAAMVRS